MSNKLISPRVACPTQTCDLPDPCYLDVTIENKAKKKTVLEWKGEHVIPPTTVIDEGKGVVLDITINDKKHSGAEHKAILTSKNYKKDLKIGSSESVPVSYNSIRDAGTFSAANLLNTFINMLAPVDAFRSPRKYTITATNCFGSAQDWSFDVIPSVKFGFSVNFNYRFSTKKETDKDRRDKQISKLKSDRLTGEAGKNTLPKKLNKYHTGWTLVPAAFIKTAKFGMDVGFFYELAGHPYTLTPIKYEKEIDTVLDNLSGLLKISQIINDLESKLLYHHKGKLTAPDDKYPIFSFKFADIKIGLTFLMENISQRDSAKLACALEGKPFWGGSFKIDILQVLALYGSKFISSGVSRLRAALEERSKSDSFSAGINFDITFSFTVNCFVGMVQTPDKQQEFDYEGKNSFEVGFKIDAGAYIRVNVLFVEGSFEFRGELETKGSMELDPHEDGIDLVFCHEGIVLKLQFKADFSMGGKKRNSPKYKGSPEKPKWEIYRLGDPLTRKTSDIRFNLTGKKKDVPDRTRPGLPLSAELAGKSIKPAELR